MVRARVPKGGSKGSDKGSGHKGWHHNHKRWGLGYSTGYWGKGVNICEHTEGHEYDALALERKTPPQDTPETDLGRAFGTACAASAHEDSDGWGVPVKYVSRFGRNARQQPEPEVVFYIDPEGDDNNHDREKHHFYRVSDFVSSTCQSGSPAYPTESKNTAGLSTAQTNPTQHRRAQSVKIQARRGSQGSKIQPKRPDSTDNLLNSQSSGLRIRADEPDNPRRDSERPDHRPPQTDEPDNPRIDPERPPELRRRAPEGPDHRDPQTEEPDNPPRYLERPPKLRRKSPEQPDPR